SLSAFVGDADADVPVNATLVRETESTGGVRFTTHNLVLSQVHPKGRPEITLFRSRLAGYTHVGSPFPEQAAEAHLAHLALALVRASLMGLYGLVVHDAAVALPENLRLTHGTVDWL